VNFQNLLQICDNAEWKKADHSLKQLLREKADEVEPFAMAAHAALRGGNYAVARWFVHKAQGVVADNASARIEDVCIDFYETHYENAYKKLQPILLLLAPAEHPIHLIHSYLQCLYSDDMPTASPRPGFEHLSLMIEDYYSLSEVRPWQAVDQVLFWLRRGDKLMACITARFSELFYPSEANSFAALGLFNLSAGFYKNADRNFHEAAFHNTSYAHIVNLHHFYLFCRQERYQDAITIGLNIEKARILDFTGHGLLLHAMLKVGYKIEAIERRLTLLEPHLLAKKEVNPLIEAVRLRVQLAKRTHSRKKVMDALQPHIQNVGCPPAYLYLYAELLQPDNELEAKLIAARALTLDPLHPDASRWDDPEKNPLNFEYAGLFIPKEHEGGAWPTKTQLSLLEILFLLPANKRAGAWKKFTQTHSLYILEAGAARLLPFMFKKLTSEHPHSEIAQCELLKGIWRKSYFENAMKMKHVLQITSQLKDAGIDVVLLKGLANAQPLYEDLGSRPMSDVDVLITPEHMARAHSLLMENGWNSLKKPTPDRLRFAYGNTYRHTTGGMLDVHWRPGEYFSSDIYDPSDLGNMETVQLMNSEWKTLSPTLNLFCTIMHGVEWNHLSPVRWVADALLILHKFRARIDWQEMHRLARKYHCLSQLAMGLKFLTSYDDFTASLPQELQTAIHTNYDDDLLMRIRLRPRNVLASFEEAWTTIEQFRRRFNFTENDHLFIIGGDKPEYVKQETEKRGLYWLPYTNLESMIAKAKSTESNYNLILIDANLSCGFQCLNVQKAA